MSYTAYIDRIKCVCVCIYFFSNYLDCAKMVCLQSNRRERCNVQNSLLWNMPLGPSHGQERMGRVHLPACAWVCFLEIIIFLHIIHMVLGWALFLLFWRRVWFWLTRLNVLLLNYYIRIELPKEIPQNISVFWCTEQFLFSWNSLEYQKLNPLTWCFPEA